MSISASSEDESVGEEDFLIVEETEGRCISPVILKEWLIPNEKAYWHPGSPSDKLHSDYLHARLLKNPETETATRKNGKLKYPWRKIQYNKILKQGNDLRQIHVARKRFSDTESDPPPKKLTKNVAGSCQLGNRPNVLSSRQLIDRLGSISKPLRMPKSMSTPKKSVPAVNRSSSISRKDSEVNIVNVVTTGKPLNYAALSDRQETHTTDDECVYDSVIPNFEGERGTKEPPQVIDDECVYDSVIPNFEGERGTKEPPHVIDNEFIHDFAIPNSEGERRTKEPPAQVIDDECVYADGALKDTEEPPQAIDDNHDMPSWAKSLKNDMDFIKRRLKILPFLSRNVSVLASTIQVIKDGMDTVTRGSSKKEDGQCSLVLGHIPIRTQNGFDVFEGKLKSDAAFRSEFNVWMERIMHLNRGANSDAIKIQRLLKSVAHENITTFGNWSGLRKLKSEIVPCVAFKNSELFKMVIAFVGCEKEVKEWVRNTNNTRVRYHSSASPQKRKKLCSPKKKISIGSPIKNRPPKIHTQTVDNIPSHDGNVSLYSLPDDTILTESHCSVSNASQASTIRKRTLEFESL